jgi:hypothetical protein
MDECLAVELVAIASRRIDVWIWEKNGLAESGERDTAGGHWQWS